MFRTFAFAFSVFLATACRSSSETAPEQDPKPAVQDSVATRQVVTLTLDGSEYRMEFDLPAGRWTGPFEELPLRSFRDEKGRLLTYSFGVLEDTVDFEKEVAVLREIAKNAMGDVGEVQVVVPGRRVELRGVTVEGTPVKSRLVSLRPDESAPIGVSILERVFADDAGIDLEPSIASIRITRK